MKYIFSGRVLPERANVTVDPLQIKSNHGEAGLELDIKLSIGASQISAEAVINKGSTDIFTFKNIVEASVSAIVDAYGYISGRGYDIEIASVVDENANQTVFGVGVPALEANKKERPLDFAGILRNFANSRFLVPALADLREAIRSPHSGLFCFRAIECVRQHFYEKADGKETDKSWQRLRESLRIDIDYIKDVGKYALPQRHSEGKFISDSERARILQNTWRIVDRFCIYLEKGSQPLDENVFPILKL